MPPSRAALVLSRNREPIKIDDLENFWSARIAHQTTTTTIMMM